MTTTPEQARSVLVSILRRALHGPDDVTPNRWPGSPADPLVVDDGHLFTERGQHLAQPLIDPAGQEVLPYAPTRCYGVGVLFPSMTAAEGDALTQEQSLNADDPADQIPTDDPNPTTEVPDLTDGLSGEAEETVFVRDRTDRPRTLGISVHLPKGSGPVLLTLTGARYERLNVSVEGRPMTLWRRLPIAQTLHFRADRSCEHNLPGDDLRLRVGIDSRHTDDGHLVTAYAVNDDSTRGEPVAAHCLFQARLSISADALLPYPTHRVGTADDTSFDLLYRRCPVLAIGHGCDTTVVQGAAQATVTSEVVPVVDLPAVTPDVTDQSGASYAVGMADLAAMNEQATIDVQRIIDGYAQWINAQNAAAQMVDDPRLGEAALRHIEQAKHFLEDIRAGWELAQTNPEVRRCLQWTSAAMNAQRRAATAPLRATTREGNDRHARFVVAGVNPHTRAGAGQGKWRPFQVAFLLASLPAAVLDSHPRRDAVDIIWMPTGGGKTEAYLGLAAFTILWQRRKQMTTGGSDKDHVIVSMRYTLRLLTAQQVQRAAALICSLELLRRDRPDLLGRRPFRIGAWLGAGATPNSRDDAAKLLTDLAHGRERSGRAFLLTRCPWCGAQMGVPGGETLAGYAKIALRNGQTRVLAHCPASDCPFALTHTSQDGLPVLEVDEDIYSVPPAFLVGTIDKFAQLAWKPKARALFGLTEKDGRIGRKAPAPALMIQDELHLIAGPLGSLNALYEVAIDHLCRVDGGRSPQLVAATATTRNYSSQVAHLYGRDQARLVPPPGLYIDDNFFTRRDTSSPGKTYVGVCAPGYGRVVESQLRVLATLAHASGVLDQSGCPSDPWWTNLAFFSSRRSLGLQLAAVQAGLRIHMYALSRISGTLTGRVTEKGRVAVRNIAPVRELTATSRENVTALLDALAVESGNRGCVDLCFATSMVEVGVDVPRLGLMTVMGQPKSASQYIQVTGRVGRTNDAPGLVVTVLSPHNVRDRSHYETFRLSHERLYASVEPVSVTPFTPQALERGAAGVLAAMLRTTSNGGPATAAGSPELSSAESALRARAAGSGDGRAARTVDEELARLHRQAAAGAPSAGRWDTYAAGTGVPFLIGLEDTPPGGTDLHWRIPTSMRSVEPECGVTIPKVPGRAGRPADTTHGDSEEPEF